MALLGPCWMLGGERAKTCCGGRKLSRNFSPYLSPRVSAVFHGQHRYLITRVAGQFGITVSATLQLHGFIQVSNLAREIYRDWPLRAGQGSERKDLNPAWPCEILSRQRHPTWPPTAGDIFCGTNTSALCLSALASLQAGPSSALHMQLE